MNFNQPTNQNADRRARLVGGLSGNQWPVGGLSGCRYQVQRGIRSSVTSPPRLSSFAAQCDP